MHVSKYAAASVGAVVAGLALAGPATAASRTVETGGKGRHVNP